MNVLKWIGNAAIVTGLWKIGDKWRHAFLFSIAGETIWIVAAMRSGDYALATICCIFNVLALRNWYKWGQV